MAICTLGSFESNVQANQEITDLIYDDIEIKTGVKLSRLPLKHVSIYSDDGNVFSVNGFNFEIRDGMWSSPNNDNCTLVEISSLKALQSGLVQIYYLR